MDKRASGLTLLEVLVVLVIVGIVVAAVTAALTGGLFMLKQAEYKARAMGIASAKMQELLSRSYTSLDESVAQDKEWEFPDVNSSAVTFSYGSEVEEHFLGDNSIPYKNVSVNCSFIEKNIDGTSGKKKTVHLTNMVPYPPVHSVSKRFPQFNLNRQTNPSSVYSNPATTAFKVITDGIGGADALPLKINFRVAKKIEVYYNLAIKVDPPPNADPNKPETQINATSIVETRCRYDNKHIPNAAVTGTPVLTQPFISNALVIDTVPPGEHEITIEWKRDSKTPMLGTVRLREYDIYVLAYEKKE